MDEFLLRLLSTSASTAILISIAILISKSFLIEKIKNAVKFEYDVELKKLDDDLRRKTEIEISKLNNRMSIELESLKVKLGPYSESQFQIYNELWKSLCELKYTMFDLWGEHLIKISFDSLSNYLKQI